MQSTGTKKTAIDVRPVPRSVETGTSQTQVTGGGAPPWSDETQTAQTQVTPGDVRPPLEG